MIAEHDTGEARRRRPRASTLGAAAVFLGALMLWIAGQAEEQSELPGLPDIIVTTTSPPPPTTTSVATG